MQNAPSGMWAAAVWMAMTAAGEAPVGRLKAELGLEQEKESVSTLLTAELAACLWNGKGVGGRLGSS